MLKAGAEADSDAAACPVEPPLGKPVPEADQLAGAVAHLHEEESEEEASPPAPCDVESAAEFCNSQETCHTREALLEMRPLPGRRPQVGLPSVLAMPRDVSPLVRPTTEAAAGAGRRRQRTGGGGAEEGGDGGGEDSTTAAARRESRRTERERVKETSGRKGAASAKAGVDPFAGTDTFQWALDDPEEDLAGHPAGVEQSRGFSKWFAGVVRRPNGGGTGGEAGVSTDAGSGLDESSDEEAEQAASLPCDGASSAAMGGNCGVAEAAAAALAAEPLSYEA